jgi:L-threonylcarbamoyladenylate synthase
MNFDVNKTVKILKQGGIIVAPTDTIYGVLGSALNRKTVENIYKVRARDKGKPCIVLISSFSQLGKFDIKISKEQKKSLEAFWPGKVSVVLDCKNKKFSYLHRGTDTIAFRMVGPKNKNLYKVISKAGPLSAPSANPEGLPSAKNIVEAKKYFGNKIDLYINGGTKISKPSTLIRFKDGEIEILRQGSVKIKTSR